MAVNNELNTATVAIPIVEGGTAKNSFVANTPVSAGTTSTGAFQSIASAGNAGQFLQSQGAGALAQYATMSGRLLSVQAFVTGTGTYTPTSIAVNNLLVECFGAGGGGAGTNGATSNFGAGGGGASGGYVRKWITNIGTSYTATYAVGAGGAEGAAGSNNGSAGGATTFIDGSFSLSAAGGGGGIGSVASTIAVFYPGGAPGTSSGGDINCNGGAGWTGLATTLGANGGAGGIGMYAGGAPFSSVSTNAGDDGNFAGGQGGGGSGGCTNNDAVNRTGGDGAQGKIFIWEYS